MASSPKWNLRERPGYAAAGDPSSRVGVNDIETRLWIAYGLIALMIAAAIVGTLYLRHNGQAQKYRRQQERARRHDEDRPPDA